MISSAKGDEIMFDDDAVLFETRVFATNKCPGDIRDAFILDLLLGEFCCRGSSGFICGRGSSIVALAGAGDMHAFDIAVAVETVRAKCLWIGKDFLVHVQGTCWGNQDRALADKVLVVDDGEGGMCGDAPYCQGRGLETQGFAEEGVEEWICEH